MFNSIPIIDGQFSHVRAAVNFGVLFYSKTNRFSVEEHYNIFVIYRGIRGLEHNDVPHAHLHKCSYIFISFILKIL